MNETHPYQAGAVGIYAQDDPRFTTEAQARKWVEAQDTFSDTVYAVWHTENAWTLPDVVALAFQGEWFRKE
jgi:hypothetical protein